jgi:hypothetical protein
MKAKILHGYYNGQEKKLVGAECWHGSPGIPVKEKIQAINVNIKDKNVQVEFESGCFTRMDIETMDELLEQWEDGYAKVEYNPWSCSITRREGMLEQLII